MCLHAASHPMLEGIEAVELEVLRPGSSNIADIFQEVSRSIEIFLAEFRPMSRKGFGPYCCYLVWLHA